jgi:hypothetical protein
MVATSLAGSGPLGTGVRSGWNKAGWNKAGWNKGGVEDEWRRASKP